jgi:hypothetical protein
MGFFGNRKKKKTEKREGGRDQRGTAGQGQNGEMTDELWAVITAAVTASNESAIPGLTSEESVALFTAAIAAWEDDMNPYTNLVIRPIDRRAGQIPAWGVAGNRETIEARKM